MSDIQVNAAHVQVRGLVVTVTGADGAPLRIVDDVSFDIPRGQVLALIGESGSGKTTIALALLGHARHGARLGGAIRVGQATLDGIGEHALAAQRGHRIAYVAQSAAHSFNPSRRIIDQVIEPALIHRTATAAEAKARAIGLFRALALPTPETVGDRYPHELSGGQLQRLMAAMALITKPELVILDEPTTALDVTTQVEVLQALKAAIADEGVTAVYVSHDLAVVAQMADRILVLNRGTVREENGAAQLLRAPADAYTRSLIDAAHPQVRAQAASRVTPVPLLEVQGIVAGYSATARVLDTVSLRIDRGGALGVIGESGSGKSTIARVVAGLLAPSSGAVLLDGAPMAPALAQRSPEELRRVQIVFQNADTALNPAHSVAQVLARPLRFYHDMKGARAAARVAELLDLIQLPASVARRNCGELSGGQKQRLNLARALAAEPDVILCDEVTSALDTVVRGAILELLAELRRDLGVAYMFISHDIATVKALCDDIVVLYRGVCVEHGPREGFGRAPWHPYTNLLIGSVPALAPGWLGDRAARSAAALPSAAGSAELCRFLPRCPVAIGGRCDRLPPPERQLDGNRTMLCHRTQSELATADGN